MSSQGSDIRKYVTMTPRKLFASRDFANSNPLSPLRTQNPQPATRYTPRSSQRSQAPSVTVIATIPAHCGQTEPQASYGKISSPSFEAYSQFEPDTEDDDGRRSSSKQRRSTSFEVRSQLVPEAEEGDECGDGFKSC